MVLPAATPALGLQLTWALFSSALCTVSDWWTTAPFKVEHLPSCHQMVRAGAGFDLSVTISTVGDLDTEHWTCTAAINSSTTGLYGQ